MKVMSINSNWTRVISKEKGKGPKYGEVCTVIGEKGPAYPSYILQEYPDEHGYTKNNFIPLSDIDETEMKRDKILTEKL